MKPFAVVAALVIGGLAHAGPRPSFAPRKDVEPEGFLYPRLSEWKASLTKRYTESKTKRADIGKWTEIESDANRRLFPEYRFFAIEWSERQAPDIPENALVICAGSLAATLAIKNDGSGKVHAFYGGPYDEFERFLQFHKTKLRTKEDAQGIWNAFCDVHRNHWHQQTNLKISDTAWELGIIVVDDIRYSWVVTLDSQHQVTTFKQQTANKTQK